MMPVLLSDDNPFQTLIAEANDDSVSVCKNYEIRPDA